MSSSEQFAWQQAIKTNGGIIETHETIKARERPHIHDEVLAPAAQAAFFGGLILGGVAGLFVIDDPWSWLLVWRVVAWAAIGAGIAGGGMAVYQLPSYRSMLTRWQKARLNPRQPEPDGRGRILTEQEPGRWNLSRCSAPFDWMRRLARQVFNDRGEWAGGDKPVRRHFAGIITAYTDRFNDESIHKDLYDLEWITSPTKKDGLWTDKAREELRDVLFVSGGNENG